MDLFEEILHESCLLMEDASINGINDAIVGMHPAWIKYNDGQGGGGKNKRYICPIAYGISTAGNPVVRAFQPQGSSKRGANKWKLFRLDRITSWRTIGSQTFDPEQLIGINPTGDAQMETVYTISPIGKAKEVVDRRAQNGQQGAIKSGPITKQDIDGIEVEEPQKEKSSWSAKDIINGIFAKIRSKFSKKQDTIVDTEPKTDYINNRNQIDAPEPEPIFKSELNGLTDKESMDNSDEQQKNIENTENEPITKDDLSGDGNSEKEQIKANFNDLMNRMEKVNNNEEDNI